MPLERKNRSRTKDLVSEFFWTSTAILEARLKWSSVIKVLRENDYTFIFPYVTTIPSKREGRINTDVFSNERLQKFTCYEQQQKNLSYSGQK